MNNKSVTVGVLGPGGSYSEEAARSYFKSCCIKSDYLSPQGVVEGVSKLMIDYGVVPIENSIQGGVYATLDALLINRVEIIGELVLPIHHVLACHDKAEKFARVLSHEQALEQCKDYLRAEHPGCVFEQIASTSLAAKKVSEGLLDSLVICSAYAASAYNLRIISKDIASSNNNETRFLIVGNNLTESSGNDKTSIIISLADKPGALYNALGVFYKNNINLTWLLSRPTKKRLGEYIFSIDLDGHREDEVVKLALRQLKKYTTNIKILGSYPKRLNNIDNLSD